MRGICTCLCWAAGDLVLSFSNVLTYLPTDELNFKTQVAWLCNKAIYIASAGLQGACWPVCVIALSDFFFFFSPPPPPPFSPERCHIVNNFWSEFYLFCSQHTAYILMSQVWCIWGWRLLLSFIKTLSPMMGTHVVRCREEVHIKPSVTDPLSTCVTASLQNAKARVTADTEMIQVWRSCHGNWALL